MTDESLADIVDRLGINWSKYNEKIGEPLMRLIACLGACEDVNLSGIDRDLIVYALAKTRSTTQPQLFTGCLRDGVCRGLCRNTDCPNYDLVVAARVCVVPKEDEILYPSTNIGKGEI